MSTTTQKRDNIDAATILVDAGFSENEAAIYLSLLKLGQTGVSAIARDAHMHGQLVYRAIESLDARGLIEKVMINNRARFTARSPERILEKLDATREKLGDVVEDLELLHTPALKDQIQFTQGTQHFVQNELDVVTNTPRKSEILVIGGGSQYWRVMGNRMNEHDYIRHSRNITIRYIGSEDQREMFRRADLKQFAYRLLSHSFGGDVNHAIFSEYFATYIFTDPPTSMYLKNKSVAESQRSFFEALWKMGK